MQICKANKMEISGGPGLPVVHARGISQIRCVYDLQVSSTLQLTQTRHPI